jgi:hypothetical protein
VGFSKKDTPFLVVVSLSTWQFQVHFCVFFCRQELFLNLMEQFLSSDILTSHRACMMLQQTLKELSTKRLAIGHRNFEEVYTSFNKVFCFEREVIHLKYLLSSPILKPML